MRRTSYQVALAAGVVADTALHDALRQLETLDRDLLTRRDVERLFGVSRARAAQLMRTFGAARVGAARVLRRTALLRQLRPYRQRAAFRGEEERRTRLVAALRQARLTGIRERTLAGLTAARARGRKGGRTFALSKAQVRLAQAAMAHRDTSVSALCRELGITPVTLYRYVGPQGQLREQGEKVLAT